MRKLKVFIAAAVISLAMSLTAFAGEWKQDTTGWWYQNDDGTYPASGLTKIGYNWFYFDSTGYMKTGWLQLGNDWYGFSDNGYCQNPCDYSTGAPIGGPYKGWLEYSADYMDTANDLANGSVVYYNNRYWCDPNAYQDTIVYYHDVAPEPVKDRFGLADMQ